MAVLEAFVYDPLISWRLLYQNQNRDRRPECTFEQSFRHGRND